MRVLCTDSTSDTRHALCVVAHDQAYLQSKILPGMHDLNISSLPGLSGLASAHAVMRERLVFIGTDSRHLMPYPSLIEKDSEKETDRETNRETARKRARALY